MDGDRRYWSEFMELDVCLVSQGLAEGDVVSGTSGGAERGGD